MDCDESRGEVDLAFFVCLCRFFNRGSYKKFSKYNFRGSYDYTTVLFSINKEDQQD